MSTTRRQVLAAAVAVGVPWTAVRAQWEAPLLSAAEAFQIRGAAMQGEWLVVDVWVAPGYAIYAEKTHIKAEPSAVTVAALLFPKGSARYDEGMAQTLTYLRGLVRVRARLTGVAGAFKVTATTQGCADAGVCYPPVSRTFQLG